MSEQVTTIAAVPQGLPPSTEGMLPASAAIMTQALPGNVVTQPEYGVSYSDYGINLPAYGTTDTLSNSVGGESTNTTPISRYEQMTSVCETPSQLRSAVYQGMYSELQGRVATNPNPTEQEIQMGTYEEGVEPQARDAVMVMRDKGYNTLSSGFNNQGEGQGVNFDLPLSESTVSLLQQHGFELGTALFHDTDDPARGTWKAESAAYIIFKPENPMDLSAIKSKWDELARILPDLGHQASPAMHGFAENFRQAARANTLQGYVNSWGYKPDEPASKEPVLKQTIVRATNKPAEQQNFSHIETTTETSRPNSISERIKARVEEEVVGLAVKIGEKAVEDMLTAEYPEYSLAIKLAGHGTPNEQQREGRMDDSAKTEATDIEQGIRAAQARHTANELAQAAAESYGKLNNI